MLNRILAALPNDESNRIAPYVESMILYPGRVLFNFGDAIHHVYFIESGMSSLLSITENGAILELGLIGNEGVIGIPLIFGDNTMPYQVLVQMQGAAMKMESTLLQKEFRRCGLLHDLLLRYAYTLVTQFSQSAVCNRFHKVEQRLCRWLLTTSDRVLSSEFRFTQESLSQMLGATRQSISVTATLFQRLGLITYNRGKISILDRNGLEAISCECYRIVKDAYNRNLKN